MERRQTDRVDARRAAARAAGIPLPALASAHPYGTLCTPLLDRDEAENAVQRLLETARENGARALLLREVALDGAAMKAFTDVLRGEGLRARVLNWHLRASLDATRDADEMLHEALSGKKLKELRRQRHRLAEHGAVRSTSRARRNEVAAALEVFLKLEAGGWKGAARHRAGASRGRRRLHPPRDAGARPRPANARS